MGETTIDFIRHGEPEGGRKYRGHGVDDPLSEKGWEQMWRAVDGERPWEHIVSSPMVRCHDFARALGEQMTVPVSVEERLREVGFGAWEGRRGTDIRAEDPHALRRFYHDPEGSRPVDAEPLDLFLQRVSAAVDDLLRDYAGRHILAVAHAGVMRAVIAHVIGAPPAGLYRISIANAARLRVMLNDERPPTLFLC